MEEVIIRAKRKGTENPFREVEKVQLEGIDILYSIDALEFEDNLPTNPKTNNQEEDKHWQEVREKAAIVALSGLLSSPNAVGSCKQFAETAVDYADALVKQLKAQ